MKEARMEKRLSPEAKPAASESGARPLVIGWREYVGFPDWAIRRVKVKIDTGARTSALGVVRYELVGGKTAGLTAELFLALERKHPERLTRVETPVLRMVAVRNSSGVWEERPLLETTLRLGPVTKRIHLTITNRAAMRFRMILGRKALENDFVVDVSQQYLLKKVDSSQ
jgi:hypothetical protein